MDRKTETVAAGVCPKLSDLLQGSDWSGRIHDALRPIYSTVGDVRHISRCQAEGQKDFFLVSFADDRSAINAANSTGCCMFGFTTVVVDLERLAGGVRAN